MLSNYHNRQNHCACATRQLFTQDQSGCTQFKTFFMTLRRKKFLCFLLLLVPKNPPSLKCVFNAKNTGAVFARLQSSTETKLSM